jgi:hypothetical protein
MSTLDLSILLPDNRQRAMIGAGPAPLRLVLLPGEILRMPRGRDSLRVLSGTAWIACMGTDTVLSEGERAAMPASRDAAVVSGLGGVPLMVELS